MSGNTFGNILRLTSFGESHGKAIGGILDGYPAGIKIDIEKIQYHLNRRRPGQSKLVSPRKEQDQVEILSGVYDCFSTGTPIAFVVWNTDQKAKDYDHLKDTFRPSHADFVYHKKYGYRDHRGGGRSSARETIARVVAGAFASILLDKIGVKIISYVSGIGEIEMDKDHNDVDLTKIEDSLVRCPDPESSKEMITLLEQTAKTGDTLGGLIKCVIQNAPIGLGEPVFDKLHADLAKAMISINAVKGFEIGSGFDAAKMKGSDHNDLFEMNDGRISTSTNYSGGIQGGISNGTDIYFNVAFKPVATLMKDQSTVTDQGEQVVLKGKGRHDVCVVPRAVPIVDAMAALVLADHYLRNLTAKI
jgi:chorismate synthase